MAQALGVVHILVSRKASEYRLSQQPDESMSAIFTGAPIGEHLTCRRGQAKCVVEFPLGEQSSVGSHDRTAKLEHQPAVEIDPQNVAI